MLHRTIFLVFLFSIVAFPSCKKRTPAAPPLALAGPPPAPPAPPAAPTISLTASRTSIDEGESATLSWKTENATSVQVSDLGSVDPNGTAQVSPLTPTTYTATATGPGGASSDTVRITVNPRPSAPPPPAPPDKTIPAVSLDDDFKNKIQDVYFDFDVDTIRRDQEPKLDTLATWLKMHPETRIVIEGHCDDRGSQEYNVALGDSRAHSALRYLSSVGISSNRMQAISYGEERPICAEQNETCWSRNRRAHFVLSVP